MADVSFGDQAFEETRTWLQHVHAEQEKRPATELFACLNRDLTIQVVNQATHFIQRAFDWRPDDSSQKIDQKQFRKAKCSLYVYYRVLQGVLLEKQQTPEAVQDVVDDVNFVESLLLVSIELVNFAWQGSEAPFPATTARLERLHLAFDMLAATLLFRRTFKAAADVLKAPPGPMPVAALECLGYMRVRIVEELALLNGSTFFTLTGQLSNTSRGAAEGVAHEGGAAAFEGFVETYATMARERCFQVCTELVAAVPASARLPNLEAQTQQLLNTLLLQNFHVAFNQHQLNLVSCCVYAATRVLGATVPFRRINETAATVFPLQDPALFSQADVGSAAGEVKLGDTRQFYNDVFLPAMEEELQSLIVVHKAAAVSIDTVPEAAPDSKLHNAARNNPAAAPAPGSQRRPFAALSASDRNTRRNSSLA